MYYKFTYLYKDRLVQETFSDKTEKFAIAKFLWLSEKKIPFRIITYTGRRHKDGKIY